MFEAKPEMLTSSDKTISLAELSTFDTIATATDFPVEKEIESILRLSHPEQFKCLEKKLGIPLDKDLPGWSAFVEVTERRNLFVHTDGVVSTQYLTRCSEHGVDLGPNLEVGSKLVVDHRYFEAAHDSVMEIGVKLAHVVWRKLQPGERAEADKALNDLCYELIYNEEYSLAIELLRFGTEVIPKHATEEMLLYMRLNRAQAHNTEVTTTGKAGGLKL